MMKNLLFFAAACLVFTAATAGSNPDTAGSGLMTLYREACGWPLSSPDLHSAEKWATENKLEKASDPKLLRQLVPPDIFSSVWTFSAADGDFYIAQGDTACMVGTKSRTSTVLEDSFSAAIKEHEKEYEVVRLPPPPPIAGCHFRSQVPYQMQRPDFVLKYSEILVTTDCDKSLVKAAITRFIFVNRRKPDLSSPENALRSYREAHLRRDVDAIIESSDFHYEAIQATRLAAILIFADKQKKQEKDVEKIEAGATSGNDKQKPDRQRTEQFKSFSDEYVKTHMDTVEKTANYALTERKKDLENDKFEYVPKLECKTTEQEETEIGIKEISENCQLNGDSRSRLLYLVKSETGWRVARSL